MENVSWEFDIPVKVAILSKTIQDITLENCNLVWKSSPRSCILSEFCQSTLVQTRNLIEVIRTKKETSGPARNFESFDYQ